MFQKSLFIALIALAFVTMACGITVDLPFQDVKTGPTQTEEINIPVPEAAGEVTDLTLTFGAGELVINPGAGNALVEGTATYNVNDFKPEITSSGNRVSLQTGDLEINGIPNFGDDIENRWDLELGDTPINLTVNAGAYQGEYEFGGLALRSLDVGDGASDVEMRFSEPNTVEMDTLRYETGASKVELMGLGNANFESMIFRGGAGDYTLDFSGELQRDAVVDIESGISNVTVIVPEGVSARVTFDGGLTNIDSDGSWEQSGDDYILAGEGPSLLINIDMGAGNLDLRNR